METSAGLIQLLKRQELDALSIEHLIPHFNHIQKKKGTMLMRAGRIEESAYLVYKGVVRAHLTAREKDKTFWFGVSGDLSFSYNSIFLQKAGYESISTVTDCELFKVDQKNLLTLCQRHLPLSNWLIRCFGRDLIKTEQRLINSQLLSAQERYIRLLEDMPSLVQQVPLSYIASFLGINQVTLSRVRSRIT